MSTNALPVQRINAMIVTVFLTIDEAKPDLFVRAVRDVSLVGVPPVHHASYLHVDSRGFCRVQFSFNWFAERERIVKRFCRWVSI